MRKKLLKPAELPPLSSMNVGAPDDVQRVFDELREQSDRGVALVGAAYVEELLERALERSLVLHSKKHREALFEGPNSVLGTLSAKIALAFALNIVSQRMHDDLQIVRNVRNDFAHSFEQLSFSRSPLRERVAALQLPEFVVTPNPPKGEEQRSQFMDAIRVLTVLLLAAARDSDAAAQHPSPAKS